MKKKAKILTTVASLCLAVALMAFGVYAMTQATIAVTSQVNFVVTDVFVDVEGHIYSGANFAGKVELDQDDSTEGTQGYTGTTRNGNEALSPGEATVALTAWTTPVVELNSTTDTAVWELVVSNISTTNSVTIAFSEDTFKAVAGTIRTAYYQTGADVAAARLATQNAYFTAETAATRTDTAVTLATQTLAPNTTMVIVLQRDVVDYSKKINTTNSISGTVTIANVSNPISA